MQESPEHTLVRCLSPIYDLISHIYTTILVTMSKVSISELKANLSRYIREVRRGGEVQVLDRGTPVAWLKPAAGLEGDADAQESLRAMLVADGVLRPGSGRSAAILDQPLLELPVSISAALIEDRNDRL